jgi:hypothetical protein
MSRKRRAKPDSSKDISELLTSWEFEPGAINVRKISGDDGLPKLQMRLDLGVLQMELSGRPDGRRPHGCESLLAFYEHQLKEHRQRNGTDLGFHLTPVQCQNLREEASMYYYRYLGLLVLEDYHAVVRDTARNLRVLDLCGQFASAADDRVILEQYRPYILMMNARAKASILYAEQHYSEALQVVRLTLRKIRRFFDQFGQRDIYKHASEVRVLKRFGREIRRKMPVDPMTKLQRRLDRAVQEERYEEAAKLRDQIKSMVG